jgi:hypothetical protein
MILIRIRKARLEKMIDGLYRVIDLEATFQRTRTGSRTRCGQYADQRRAVPTKESRQ